MRLDKGLSNGEVEVHRRALAALLRRLEPQIEQYADQRLGLVDGSVWNLRSSMRKSFLRVLGSEAPQVQICRFRSN